MKTKFDPLVYRCLDRFGSAIQTLDSNNPDSIKAMVNSLKDSNDEDS